MQRVKTKRKIAQEENWLIFQLKGMRFSFYATDNPEIWDALLEVEEAAKNAIQTIKNIQLKRRNKMLDKG